MTDQRGASAEPAAEQPTEGGWAPLRYPAFRRMWTAQFTSNVGSWMQTVAAQWLMLSLTSSAVLLGAISAAGSIPVLLLAVPAGVLGDLFDRRRLVLGAQAAMLIAAAALAVVSAIGAMTPALLLLLLFALGAAGALSAPVWQTLQPELVPASEISPAIALGSVNQNLARAVGPAIGGLLLAATSAALVFGVNALSFVAVLAAVAITRIPRRELTLPREHAFAATKAGGRFVTNSPVLVQLIIRSVAFVFFAGAIWALLPLVARYRLGLGSGGYGLLLACVGVGALLAATFGPALKRRVVPRAIFALACVVVAAAAAVLALSTSAALAAVVLVAAGAAWITGLGLLSASYQGQLPAWVKARSFAYYLIAFQGANGIGALALAGVANGAGVRTALLVVAIGLALVAVATWALALPPHEDPSVHQSEPLPLPELRPEGAAADERDPVMVLVEYLVRADAAQSFTELGGDLRRLRRRTGAVSWQLYRDLAETDRFTETFVVCSWRDHERQHERVEHQDAELLARIDGLLVEGTPRAARHLLGVRVRRR